MSLMSIIPPGIKKALNVDQPIDGGGDAQGGDQATAAGAGTAAPQAAAPAGDKATNGKAPDAAAAGDAGTQAKLGADGAQPTPPVPAKLILSSVLRGAVTGASLLFTANKFAPGMI